MYFDENFNQIHFRTFYISGRFLKKISFTVEFCFIGCLQVKQDIIDILCIFFSTQTVLRKKILNIEFVNFLRLRFIE